MKNKLIFGYFLGIVLILSCSEDNSVNPQKSLSSSKMRISPVYITVSKDYFTDWIEVANRSSKTNSTLTWKISEYPEWITFSKTSGIIEDNGEESINWSVDTTYLKNDTIGHIKFSSNGGDTIVYVGFFSDRQVPSHLYDVTDEYIISKVGQEFFEKNYALLKERSEYYHPKLKCLINPLNCTDLGLYPRYGIHYSMDIEESPFAHAIIGIDIDENGVLLREKYIGIPDCINNPLECIFPIDADSAKTIAALEGLEEGLLEWETTFRWYTYFHDELNIATFAWLIRNTLSESGQGEGSQRSGRVFVIDANSGELLIELAWYGVAD